VTTPLLKWTGHPLADVGVATGKDDPAELTLEVLDSAGKEIKAAYEDSAMVSFLSCVYMNAPYIQPNMKPEEYAKKTARLTQPHRGKPDVGIEGLVCAFSGDPAHLLLRRSDMPMLMGEDYLNFYPAGLTGLPVAAPYGLAIHALALGGRRSEGKLLIVHCDDPKWTLQFVRRYVARNRLIINLSRENRLPAEDDPENLLGREAPGGLNKEKRPKYPDAKAPESLVMDDLVEVVSDRKSGAMRNARTSVTVYLLSNSGQGPSLAIEQIPGGFVEFLMELHGSAHASRWQRLVQRAWRAGKGGEAESGEAAAGKKTKRAAKPAAPQGPGRSRNDLYNDLLPIFEHGFCDWRAGARFIRRHLLSEGSKYYFDLDKSPDFAPRFGYEQLELIDWSLTALFLERVLGMKQERIALIKAFATRLAELIDEHNDKRLFRELVYTTGEWQYRAILSKVQMQYAKDRGKLALGFDEYVDVFLNADADERASWSLVRDLISIRLVERLFEQKFFDRGTNREVLESPTEAAA
jgi:CRISPR-associated protein Cst1